MDKEQAKQQIERLVNKFAGLTSAEHKKENESMTCKDFILPLFQALGWDVYNNYSNNEVTSETQVSGGRADYAFHVNDVIKFFIEAKKPSVDLREAKHGEQAISYAWHKSVPWAILTDFEDIKVYNAEWDEPDAERSLIFEINYFYKEEFLGVQIKTEFLENIPIPKIDFKDKKEKAKHDDLVKLADKMLEKNNEIKEEVEKTDKEIDKKVYELYGLTKEEIGVVEKK